MVGRVLNTFWRDQESRIADFWSWFLSNEGSLVELDSGDHPLMRELSNEIGKIKRGLAVEIGSSRNGRRRLTISADGNRDRFPMVQKLVDSAPPLPKWDLISFRQRKDSELWDLRMGGVHLNINEVWFRAMEAGGGRVGLKLYVRGLNQAMKSPVQLGTMLFLESALGEYDLAVWIASVDWQPLPVDPVNAGLHHMRELPEIMDKLKAIRPEPK